MNKKPRILFTTPVLQYPAVGGPFLRIENSIKALSQISNLTIYCRTPVSRAEIDYYKSWCDFFFISPSATNLKWTEKKINSIFRLLFKLTHFSVFNEKNDEEYLLDIIRMIKPDIIWLGYGNISYPLVKFLKEKTSLPVVCDTDSVWSRFILRGIPYLTDPIQIKEITHKGKEKEEEEQWGTQLADITTAVSEIDADYYRKHAKKPDQIKVFSNVIDLNNYKLIPPKIMNFHHPCIYLAGTFWENSPMEESARWVIDKILPLIKKEIPNIHLYIIGNNSNKILEDIKDPSITITGMLPIVLPYLCHADVAIVPLKFESGTRFKILEAGACKIPVVSTTLGAEGIPVTHEIDILIADEPDSFSRAIISLISNPEYAKKIGNKLHSLIAEKYDIPALINEGREIIESISNMKKKIND
ncbi:glycosyltransferase family 4 protein [Methanospirillum lacunae]|uniref:Glycosyltransferase n=1 Tax=Methanospirillum lacunae TaxID=668570 RepID=A0A2V2MR37_9EURY|nr:glycosyltransferase family 4 protein [Methanospirillum lacunae]PWR70694.1 hypothetical protein DK846_13875 [Methanospirillum lacunae]